MALVNMSPPIGAKKACPFFPYSSKWPRLERTHTHFSKAKQCSKPAQALDYQKESIYPKSTQSMWIHWPKRRPSTCYHAQWFVPLFPQTSWSELLLPETERELRHISYLSASVKKLSAENNKAEILGVRWPSGWVDSGVQWHPQGSFELPILPRKEVITAMADVPFIQTHPHDINLRKQRDQLLPSCFLRGEARTRSRKVSNRYLLCFISQNRISHLPSTNELGQGQGQVNWNLP